MDSQTVQTSGIKNYNAEVVLKATRILAEIDTHLDASCDHCKALLEQIYKIEFKTSVAYEA